MYDYGLGRISDYPERLEELESYKECIRPAKNSEETEIYTHDETVNKHTFLK